MALPARPFRLALLLLVVWAAASGFSLVNYRKGPDPLPTNLVTAVALDGDGVAWIGTGGGGLLTLSASGEWAAIPEESGFTAKTVNSIAFAKDRVLVGTERGLFTRKGGAWTAQLALPDGRIEKPEIAVMGEDLWIGALGPSGGLFHGSPDGTWERIKGPGGEMLNDILALCPVGDILWIGTMNNGLWRYQKGAWKKYEVEQGLPHFLVSDIQSDGEGLWLSFLQAGIAYMKDDKVTVYTEAEGLPSPYVRKLLWDDDREELWVGTVKNGVARFDGSRWVTYGEADGLKGLNTYSLAKGKRGVWIGTNYGVVYLEP